MGVELKITYAGSEPGLERSRLSLSSFAEPLKLLVSAVQRTASGILSDALDDPRYGSRGGQVASEAKLLDLELVSIDPGSACPVFECVARPSPMQVQTELFDDLDLAARALKRVIDDIGDEQAGKPRNASVRRYLSSIPGGVAKQRYTAKRDGAVIAEVEFGQASLAVMPTQLPRLIAIPGNVVSVGFPPGVAFVSIRTTRTDRTIKCEATPEQVNTALSLRDEQVIAAILDGERPRLLWVRSAAERSGEQSVSDTFEHLMTKWKRTMEILAK